MKLLALLLIPTATIAASGGKAVGLPSSAPAATSQTTRAGHGGGSSSLQREDLRNPPPLDPKREVTEQRAT